VTDQTRNNRMVLLLIAGIPITMILAATWLWWFVVRGDLDLVGMIGTANRGELVQPPRRLDEAGLFDSYGREFRYGDLEPRWSLLVPANGGVCDQQCESSLYLTRQIHKAMGKEFNRIRRLYANDAPVAETRFPVAVLSDQRPAPDTVEALLETEHKGLQALTLGPDAYDALFAEHQRDPSTWYLVDPGGWVMMSYDSDVDYKDVISDLKFLLKNSSR
jgi:hypothetical protein